MGSRDGGADGTANGVRRAEPDKPVRSLRPLTTIGTVIAAPGSRRTLTFPAEQVGADEERPEREDKRARRRAETIVPAALDSSAKEEPPSEQPALRWTTPNRRPPSFRAVERAARSSERLLRSNDDALSEADLAPEPETPEERPSDRATVPNALFAKDPADGSSAAKEASAANVASAAKESTAADDASAVRESSAADDSSSKVVELSTSDLQSDHEVLPNRTTSSPPPLPKRPSYLAGLAAITRAARATVPAPPAIAKTTPWRPTLRSGAIDRTTEQERASLPPGEAPKPPAPANDLLTLPLGSLTNMLRPPALRPPRPEPRTPPFGSPITPVAAPKFDDPTSTLPLGTPPMHVAAPRPEPVASPRLLPAIDARATDPLVDLPRPLMTEPPPSAEPHVSTALSVSPGSHVARDPAGDRMERRRRLRRIVVPLVASYATLAATVGVFVAAGRAPKAEAAAREPRIVVDERSPLAGAPTEPVPLPPLGGCLTGEPRTLASRAQLGPGLDVAVLDTGFAVGLASGATEALGVRMEGSGLRVVETIRVRTPITVRHVTVDPGRDDDEALDVRLDTEDARTVFAGDNPAFRVMARGGGVMAIPDERSGMRPRFLWPLPSAPRPAAAPSRPVVPRPVAAPARSRPLKPSIYVPPGIGRPADVPVAVASPAPVLPEVVRVAPRDDGGAVVAIRRPATLFVGLVDGSLTPAGPLVTIFRKGATLGAPAVAQWRGGAVVAWAERAFGEREFDVVVASIALDDNGTPVLGPVRVIGKGMSPTIAAMPDGDLLLAYADGASGAHRVVVRRLAGDLDSRGEPLVVSPESVNAGQPAVAVRADGRALVAFFAADRGTSGSVHAMPLACDPGI